LSLRKISTKFEIQLNCDYRIIMSKAIKRGRKTTEAIERGTNMTDQPSAQQISELNNETTNIKLLYSEADT